MKQIIVGSVLFLGGILGTISLFFITSNKINAQVLMPLINGSKSEAVASNVDFNMLHSLIDMGLKAPLFIFMAIMFMGFYFLLSGLENKVYEPVKQNCSTST